ncbi:energy transducer TonB [Pseudomonas sp. RIT-PI-S]|uniref:energy transducer TonB n=1 Tax=Pseudomonas sp. RIT-PI-S TaxID=3035295 RepID=UPI0021D7D68E|nr:energy transducer TonB [Pseudomonas sp. RIT-PI-S]
MTDLISPPVGYVSPVGNFSRRNTQTLGGVSQLWQDFFASALNAHGGVEEGAEAPVALLPNTVTSEGEPVAATQWLEQVNEQRDCDIADQVVEPPKPLFLPIAELDTNLLPPAAKPYPPEEVQAQQYELDLDTGWHRPLVLNNGQPIPTPGPAPKPRALYLPIAEFETDLLPPPNEPYDDQTLIYQQREFDFDSGWARPIVLQNLRVTA